MIKMKKILTLFICLMTVLSSPNFIYGFAEVLPAENKEENLVSEQKKQEVKEELNQLNNRIDTFYYQHQNKSLLLDDAAGPLGALQEIIEKAGSIEKLQLVQDYFEYFETEYQLGFMTYNLEDKIAELENKKADLTGERKQKLEEKIAEAKTVLNELKPLYEKVRGIGGDMFNNKVATGDGAGFEALKATFNESNPKDKVQNYQDLSAQLSQQYTDLKNQEDKLKLVEKYEAMVIEKATEYKAKVDEAKKFLVKEERDAKKVEIDGARRSVFSSLQAVGVGDENIMQQAMEKIINEFEQSAQNSSEIQGYGQVKKGLQDYIATEVEKIQDVAVRQKIQRELLLKVDKLDSEDKVDELKQKIDKRIADPKSGSWASKNEDIINNPAVKDVTAGLAAGLHDGFKSQDNNASNSSVVPAKTEGAKKVRSVHKVSVPKTGV